MQCIWQKIIKNTITITFFIYMLHTSYVFTPADIISIIGLFFAILSYIEAKNAAKNAKNAEERAQEAVQITKEKANKYSDQLLLHSGVRLTSLVQLALKAQSIQNSIDICDVIRREIVNFRNGITTISKEQKTVIQEIIMFLARYNGSDDDKRKLREHVIRFEDLISNLVHNEDNIND